jgi:acetolactate synthase regulatory subunit
MQWLITLDTENDLIVTCRLMNVFRRKGLKIATLAMAARPQRFSMMAVLDSPGADIDHLFHYLRGMEGVEHVSYYQHHASADASFVFVDAGADPLRVSEVLSAFPRSNIVFASHGKYLLEVPAGSKHHEIMPPLGLPEFRPYAFVKSTLSAPALV